eukprot:14496-Heterococcus_DN1.PRE.1
MMLRQACRVAQQSQVVRVRRSWLCKSLLIAKPAPRSVLSLQHACKLQSKITVFEIVELHTRCLSSASKRRGTPIKAAGIDPKCVINSHTEWDPLEEVIVGSVEGATIPEWHVSGKAVWPPKHWSLFKDKAGQPFPLELMQGETVGRAFFNKQRVASAKELDGLAKILEREGVTVRRPDVRPRDFAGAVKTPDFESKSQMYAAMPRDVLITVGNQIIEAPMAWRSRYFEFRPYRKLIKEYFSKGGSWTAAPKPEMSDELYVPESQWKEGANKFVTTEYEPVFDAAEFTRIGRDIFTQRSQVTNDFGIEWMRRHLGSNYNIHVLDFQDKNAMHIDGTFVPLGPGK